MAVDIEALKALGLSDQEINQLVAIEAGGFPTRAAAPQQVTNRVAGAYDYTPLYGAGEIIPGLTASIFQNLGIENPNVPVFELLGSANKGGNNANERMVFAAQPGQSYRLVNNATGQIVGEARTPEEISSLVAQSNALSKQLGKKADLSFEQSTPEVLGGGYSPIFQDQPNILFDTPMKLIAAGMLAATGAGLLQPGGLGGVGAAGTGGATGTTAAATGSGLVPGAVQGANALSFAPVATTAVPASTIAGAVGAAAVPAAAAAGDLVVTALIAKGFTAAQAAALVASGGAAAALASTANAGTTAGSTAPSSSATTPSSTTPPTGTPATSVLPNGAEIVLTGSTPTNLVPASLLAGGGAAAAAAANAAGSTSTFANEAAMKTGMTPEEIAALNAGVAGAGGVLGTGLTASQLATLASLGISGIGSLFGNGGGAGGAAVPYTSTLGPMPSFGGRTQINPNITDYEKYGFGPEAQFFSGAATSPGAIASPATTAAVTTPAATTPATNLLDNAASARLTLNEGTAPTGAATQIGGNLGRSTPENTGMTQERLDQLQTRYENMRTPEFFQYFKSVNDVLDTYADRGYMTPEQAKAYQGRLEAAASSPNANLASLQSAVPMPQIGDFLKPTGTPAPVTYTAPAQPITDRSAYINDLYKQLGANVSQGLLAVPQAQTLQSQLRQAYLNPQSTTEQLQGIYNTGMQQYKPLVGGGLLPGASASATSGSPMNMTAEERTRLAAAFGVNTNSEPVAAPGGSWDFYNRQRQQQQMFEAADPGLVLRDGMTSDEFEKYMQARDAFDRSATQTNAGSSQAPAGAETVVRGLLG